jgi:tetratricopeptide (TPR) repeat protein
LAEHALAARLRVMTRAGSSIARSTLFYAALAAIGLCAYGPALNGGLLWDDEAHLIPPALASWSGLARLWTDFTQSQQYYPVASTAFWAMNRLWGHEPLGYHVANVLLHALSALLIARLAARWSLPGGLLAAVVFLLHPVHVESVAWISELKNTLSTAFCLLAALAYVDFDATRRRDRYAAALAFFALALGSKSVTAVLPAALLVVAWWRRGRISWRDAAPLLPFFALGIAAGLATAWLEYAHVGAQGDAFALGAVERVLLAGRALWFYFAELLWPVDLAFSYPRWSIDAAAGVSYAFPLGVAAVLAALWSLRARTRGPLAAALCYAGVLSPALGFVNVFPFRYSYVADHFQYLASVPAILAICAGLVLALRRLPRRVPQWLAAAVLAAPLFALCRLQSRCYADAETLWRATIASNPHSLLARNNLAALLLQGPPEGWDEAALHAEAAVAEAPQDAETRNNLGLARLKQGRPAEAERELRYAIEREPRLAAAYDNLGHALNALGRHEEALSAFGACLERDTGNIEARRGLAVALEGLGRLDAALGVLREASQRAPDDPDVQLELGNVLQLRGQLAPAIDAYRRGLRLRPEWGEAWHNLAIAQSRAGRADEAVAAFAEAERLLPRSAAVQLRFAAHLVTLDRLDEAAVRLERATGDPAIAPDALLQLALLRERQGRADEAVRHLEAALRLRPDFAEARTALARQRAR